MTPLDDELRSLFHARTDQLAPPSDPLGGIERRAKRMRRNRVAVSVAGSALLVAGIAIAVPTLSSGDDRPTLLPATQPPSASATAVAGRAYGPNELDPANPWE